MHTQQHAIMSAATHLCKVKKKPRTITNVLIIKLFKKCSLKSSQLPITMATIAKCNAMLKKKAISIKSRHTVRLILDLRCSVFVGPCCWIKSNVLLSVSLNSIKPLPLAWSPFQFD